MTKIYKSRIIPVLPHVKGHKILDIGCVGMGDNDVMGGEDFMFGYLVDKGYDVLGLDINADGLKKFKTRGYKAVCFDAQEPYDLKQKFDTIIAEENIEHISNLKTYLDNVKNHLNPNGIFIVTTPNAQCLDWIFSMFVFRKPRTNPCHTHMHSLETFKYLLESNGFKVIHNEYLQANPDYLNLNGKIMAQIVRFFPARFGRNMLIVAELK